MPDWRSFYLVRRLGDRDRLPLVLSTAGSQDGDEQASSSSGQVSGDSGGLATLASARAREGFCAGHDGNTWLFLHGAAAAIHFEGHLTASHVIMLAQDAC